MMYVIGARGRLGAALCRRAEPGSVVALARGDYETWWQSDAADRVARHFDAAPPGAVVCVAAGLLDPRLAARDHERVNHDLPRRVIEGASRAGLRVLTFGTVMERLSAEPNAYIASKMRLGRFVAAQAGEHDALHVQIHTLYGGGPPAPFMFLGQLCSALRAGIPFEMTSGRQLREYHHVDDDAVALHRIAQGGLRGVVALSHGEPCSLRELAVHVFAAMGKSELLRIGARPDPADDNFDTALPRTQGLGDVLFRPVLAGAAQEVRAFVDLPDELPA